MKKSLLPYLYLITVQVIFGTLPYSGKLALLQLTPKQLIMLRISGATLIFMAMTKLYKKQLLPKDRRHLPILAVCGFIGITANQLLFFSGLKFTTSINASLIQMMIPVFALAIAILFRQERFHWSAPIALIVAAAGVGLLFSDQGVSTSRDYLLGNALLLLNTLAFASYLVISRKALRNVDPLRSITWTFIFGTAGMFIYFLIDTPSFVLPPVTIKAYLPILYIILFPTVIVYLFNLLAVEHIHTSIVALFIYLQPLVAISLGRGLLGEKLTNNFWLAMVLVFSGLALTRLHQQHQR